MFGGGQTKTAVRFVRACSRLRLSCRNASWIMDTRVRSRPRTTIRYPVLRRTSGLNVTISSRSLSNAGEGSWHFGNHQKGECGHPFTHPGFRVTYSHMAWRNSIIHDRLMVAFTYLPRTRPPQPVLSSPFPFLSTVKSSPEEWFQITSTISAKSIFNIEPIDCHVSARPGLASNLF
jgi:hypothetical protein